MFQFTFIVGVSLTCKKIEHPNSEVHVGNCRAVSAKAEITAGQITLLHLQRAWTMPPYTQGVAALYPGLCSSALTARAGQCVFGEQVVIINQEQFPFYFHYSRTNKVSRVYTLQTLVIENS